MAYIFTDEELLMQQAASDFVKEVARPALKEQLKTKKYLKTRTRNGKPLCSLQSVAHRIVNMEMQLEQARIHNCDYGIVGDMDEICDLMLAKLRS